MQAIETKTDAVERANRYARALQNLRQKEKRAISRAMGQLAAGAGGAMGAVAKRYLPGLIPGEGLSDDAAVWGSAFVLDLYAMMNRDGEYADEINYFAAGYGAYLAGSAVEKILP